MKSYQEIVKEDLERNAENTRTKLYLKIFRKQQLLLRRNRGNIVLFFLKLIKFIVFDKYCVEIDEHTEIGTGLRLPHLQGIVIAREAVIGSQCTIFHQVTIGVNEHRSIITAPWIGNNVYIGAGAKIVGGVKVGDCAVIGANAIVTKDVPANSTVVGVNHVIRGNKI